MSFPRFKDFAKGFNAVMGDNFDLKYQVKAEAKSDALKVKAEWEQDPAAAVKGLITVETTRSTPVDTKTTLSGTVDSKGDGKASVTVGGLAKGLDLLFNFNRKKGTDSFTLGGRYKAAHVDAEIHVDVAKESTHDVEAAFTAAHSKFVVGARAVASLAPKELPTAEGAEKKHEDHLKAYDVVAGYGTDNLQVGIDTEDKLKTLNFGFVHALTDAVDLAARLSVVRGTEEGEKNAYNVAVGGAFKQDGTTTKVKIDTAGDVFGSFSAPVRGNAVITLVGKFNTTDKSNHGVGLQLALK